MILLQDPASMTHPADREMGTALMQRMCNLPCAHEGI